MRRGVALHGPVALGAVAAALEGATVHRAGRPVLRDVDLAVHAGELLALVGPNGAGKSTALAALAGDLTPRAGRAVLLGRPLAGWSTRELALRRAVLPQAAAVAFPFRARDVVAMGRAPWAGTPAEADDDVAVAQALADAGATALADRPVPALSGGEQARVALARVLAQRTALVLLDEPTAALDLRHAEQALQTARRLADGGRAVVAVLHDLDLAAAHADRVGVLAQGRLVACGPPSRVLTGDLLSEVYGHPVDVVPDPRTGAPLVLPRR